MSHRKGRAGENEFCRFMAEAGIEVERNLNERRSGREGDLASDLPLEFEVKAKKQPSVYRALQQAESYAEGTGRHPVAVIKRKNGRGRPADRFVAMPWEDFREIVEQLKRYVW